MSHAPRNVLITRVSLSIAVGALAALAVAGCSDSNAARPSAPITADATEPSLEEAEQGVQSPSPAAPVVGNYRYGQTADFGGVKLRVDKMKTRNDGYGTIYREAGVVLTATQAVDLYDFDVTYQAPSGQVFSLSFDTEKPEMKPGQKLVGKLYTMDEPTLKLGGKVIVEYSHDDLSVTTAEWS